MIEIEDLGFRKDYRFYSGKLSDGKPRKLNVLQDLSHSGRRGWFSNDDPSVSIYMSINGKDWIEVKGGDPRVSLDHLVIDMIELECSTGNPSFRCMAW